MVAHEVEEAGVDAVRADHDLTHVVVEDASGPAAEEGEGILVAADQGGHVHRAGKLGVEVARVAEHHDEGVDLDGRAVWLGITADLGPVALGLLAGWRLEAHGQARVDAVGRELGEEAAHDFDRAGESARLDLGEEPHRRETVGLPAFGEVVAMGVELAGTLPGLRRRCGLGPQQLAHGVAGMAGHTRDLPHRVTLLLKKTNVHKLIQIKHGASG